MQTQSQERCGTHRSPCTPDSKSTLSDTVGIGVHRPLAQTIQAGNGRTGNHPTAAYSSPRGTSAAASHPCSPRIRRQLSGLCTRVHRHASALVTLAYACLMRPERPPANAGPRTSRPVEQAWTSMPAHTAAAVLYLHHAGAASHRRRVAAGQRERPKAQLAQLQLQLGCRLHGVIQSTIYVAI